MGSLLRVPQLGNQRLGRPGAPTLHPDRAGLASESGKFAVVTLGDRNEEKVHLERLVRRNDRFVRNHGARHQALYQNQHHVIDCLCGESGLQSGRGQDRVSGKDPDPSCISTPGGGTGWRSGDRQ